MHKFMEREREKKRDSTFRNGFNPPLLQLSLLGVCMARVSSGKFHASRLFVSEFEIESCSRSSSYKLPPRAADALDIIPESIHQVFVFVMDVNFWFLSICVLFT